MSQPTEEDIKKVKEDIITGLTGSAKPIFIESCWDQMFYLMGESKQIPPRALESFLQMFFGYFNARFTGETGLQGISEGLYSYFKDHPLSDSVLLKNKDTTSKKSEAKVSIGDNVKCCLPCSELRLSGIRALGRLTESTLIPMNKAIRNVEYPDAFWGWFIERTDIDKITGKILSDLEFGGKFPILYDTGVGLASQIMINEINRGMSSRVKQRTSMSLKSIGMRLNNDYAGLKISDMQITPGMIIALQLVAKMEDFYNYRKVVQTIESIAGREKISQQTIASIRTSMDLLRRASEKFRHGTNAHNTLASIVWKLAGFFLLLNASKEMGLSQERLEDMVDTARNMLLLNRIGTPSDKSKTKIYIGCAEDLRDLLLHVLAPIDEKYWDDPKRLLILLDLEEPLVEHFIANFKEATGIDLTNKKWIADDIVISHDLPNKL